jgi:serine/threonine protein kinase/tetratricopeptide (TPR) repeat protein
MPETSSSSPAADRNLLFGILALQMDFISRDALIAAMHAWVLEKAKPLGDILLEHGQLHPAHLSLLEAMVQAHIRAHHNDPQQSLAAFSSLSSVRKELSGVADGDLQASLSRVGGAGDPAEARSTGFSATLMARIEDVCDRFEASWRTAEPLGQRPRMEDYVGERAAPEYAILLCELAVLDIAYRRLAGEHPSVAEYRARFPILNGARLARLLARQDPGDPHATIGEHISPRENTSRWQHPGPELRYRIMRPHATGGLGEVFVALDQELQRQVALKEIKEEHAHDAVSRSRFLLEAEITGGLEHPGIVPVYGLGQYADGRPFYAMRFIKGDNLKEAIRRFHEAERPGRKPGERSLALRQLLRRFIDVCNAVAYAHHRGVLHRDLKPSNIMLGKYGETLIVDWGLAKPVGRSYLTRTTEESTLQPSSGSDWVATVMGTVIGTPAYMSPEQAAGRLDLLGPASDIYSLGATLYALLTGQAPFEESDKVELLQQVQRGAWRSPRQVKANTPPALDAICRKAMALQPEDRYPTALALAADVEHWLADEPADTYREPWFVRTGRWLRRHRPLVAGAAALLLAAVPLSLVIAVQAEKDKQVIAKREADAEAVLEFVENRVFAAARPEGQEGGLGRAVTLRQALEAALPFLGKSFADQPLIEAKLRNTLGTSFWHLGDAKVAAEQYEAARALNARHLGPDHPNTLRNMVNLANSYGDLGRHADALKLREETLALMRIRLGPDHPDTLRCMVGLACSYTALARYTDALKLFEETLALQKAKLGPEHPETVGSKGNLAMSYAAVGRQDEALKLYEETLALMRTKFGPHHPATLRCMMGLASSYTALGRHADALKLREETLELQKTILGPDHANTLRSSMDMASSYAALGRHADALKLFEETLGLQKAKLGPNHPDTIRSMMELANSYDTLGRHGDALLLREETLALQKAKLGPDYPDTLWNMNKLANSYAAFGRHGDAVNLHEATLALRKAKLAPDHYDTLQSMDNLALNYGALGRHAEALRLHEEALALRKTKLGPDHPGTLLSMNSVANSYAALGRHADALKLREEGLALRKAKLGPNHHDTLMSMFGVAECLIKLERGAEAVLVIDEFVERAAENVLHPAMLGSVIILRLRHFEKTKDPAGCRQTAAMWEKLNRAGSPYVAACMRAVTAAVLRAADPSPAGAKQADAEAEQAMAWLKQAVAAGYKDAAHMEKDGDLDALRDREDFQKLLAELAAGPAKEM